MRRLALALAAAALMAAMMAVMAPPAFAKAHVATGLGKENHWAFGGNGDNGWHGGSHHGTHGAYNWGIGNEP